MLKIFTFLALLNQCNCAPANTSTNGDVAPCLKEFYQAAYDGIYNCTKEFDFFVNLRISESQNLRISESQNLRISESQNLRISESQNR
ncbi:Protein CBG17021 [Caenorhabditis briggsae]|uniref:Protein CBG17021 n=1 Tax=Caenorhabditis briggsae TaxID=6238 RepID=A8XQA3_CAEBR|nr:Protein CBG17021 [Caenorhabditis briggsae]CAP34829.1 Protein CBG17021 [Caenorhabditis briggsae]